MPTMLAASNRCPRCGKFVKTARGLTQHIRKGGCVAALPDHLRPQLARKYPEFLQTTGIHRSEFRKNLVKDIEIDDLRRKMSASMALSNMEEFDYYGGQVEWDDDQNGDYHDPNRNDSDLDVTMDADDEDDLPQPDRSMNENYRKFIRERAENYAGELTKKQVDAIKLLHSLRNTKASLDTYEEVMKWHLVANSALTEDQPLSDSAQYISRASIQLFTRELLQFGRIALTRGES